MTPSELAYARTRFVWLVGVPTGACFGSWIVASIVRGNHEVIGHAVAGTLPALGLACVPLYRYVSGDFVRLWPYVPSVIAAIVFLVSMEELAHTIAREPDGASIPVLPYGLGFLLPFITLIGSSVSYVALKGFLDG